MHVDDLKCIVFRYFAIEIHQIVTQFPIRLPVPYSGSQFSIHLRMHSDELKCIVSRYFEIEIQQIVTQFPIRVPSSLFACMHVYDLKCLFSFILR